VRQRPLTGLTILLIIDFLLCIWALRWLYEPYLFRKKRTKLSILEDAFPPKYEVDPGSWEEHHMTDLEKFVRSCKRCINRDKTRMEIQFEDLGLQLKNGSRILQGVSGSVGPGNILAVMGASGAGKCALRRLNPLAQLLLT
jgi:ABC-type multidrug transport system fused ATPase/permease subunit